MRCRLCPQETGVWKYSLLQHFEQFHEGCDLLQEEVLGDDERDHISLTTVNFIVLLTGILFYYSRTLT